MILDGKTVSQKILEECKEKIEKLGLKPTLGIVSVGEDPASKVYVKFKLKDAEKVGIKATHHKLEEKTTEKELLKLVDQLNEDKNMDGFIVQLPLPKHIDENKILEKIKPEKDVDGFHPVNMGKLFLGLMDEKSMIPATPYGIMKILEYYNVELEGKNAVVVGRSNIAGKPIALLLLSKNATVTICHSRTKNLEEHTKNADILVVAVGRAKMIKENMVKEGAYVIDVGINKKNEKIVGDVDFENVSKKANCTPVPGGVGLTTRAMLMYNLVNAASLKGK